MTDPTPIPPDIPTRIAPQIAPQIPPLAEGRWLWRRVYVFGASFGLWVLLAAIVRRGDAAVLPRVVDGLIALMALVLILYLVAPTAQQLVELLANLKLRLDGGRR